jgi:hypothetical protein
MGTQLKRPQSVKSLENYVGYVNSQNKIPRWQHPLTYFNENKTINL